MITEVPDEEVNGFLAGYVGEKILLGEGKQAWALMQGVGLGARCLRQAARCRRQLPRQDRAPDLPGGA